MNETRDEFEERVVTNTTRNPEEQFEGLLFFSISLHEICSVFSKF